LTIRLPSNARLVAADGHYLRYVARLEGDRTANLPVDRQIRYAVSAQYQWNERVRVGGAIEYIDLGDAKISNPNILEGKFDKNRIFMVAANLGYQF
jgi:hypothetical protein